MKKHPQIIIPNSTSEFYTPERCHILEIFNKGTHSKSSLAQARVEPGVTTQLHILKGTDEIYYILQGEGQIELNHQKMGIIKKGEAAFIPADTPQRITNVGEEDLIFLCICTPRFVPECYQSLEQEM